ncbi:piezo-type mechanosensitive ion channel component 2-like [Brachyhypopomus gauderio]|uniref:piezo-type mechanosensitive ion channel component 2-like n=1 Tax=Brachyhypopomus gauderio TaxID=698409 RepID=UPI00404336E8
MREVWNGMKTITGCKQRVNRATDGDVSDCLDINTSPSPIVIHALLSPPPLTFTIKQVRAKKPKKPHPSELNDFSTFNTIQPLQLRDKLVRMKVDLHLVSWITDYLTGRPQYVRLKDCTSETVVSSTGAAEWSIKKRDEVRLDKLVRYAGSVVGVELNSVVTVAKRRTLHKLLSIMKDDGHPLHTIIVDQRSKFSGRFLSQSSSTDRLRKSFVPRAIRLFNSSQWSVLVKYWIFCCCFMFFIISFSGKVVVYKILYICLFLFCIFLYQVHYEVWRRALKFFWAVVVGYSMLVLILIYMYQFKTVSGLFRQIIGISEEGLRDLGLEQFDTVELFAQILLPAAFLLACILQLHYFNSDFLTLTDLQNVPVCNDATREEELREILDMISNMLKDNIEKIQRRLVKEQLSGEGDDLLGCSEVNTTSVSEGGDRTEGAPKVNPWFLVVDRISVLVLQGLLRWNRGQELCWRLVELHSFKAVASGIIWISLKEVSLLNCVFVVLWTFAVPCCTLRAMAATVSSGWACVIVICKMMYQLKFIKPSDYSINCTVSPSSSFSLALQRLTNIIYCFFSNVLSNLRLFKKRFQVDKEGTSQYMI